MEYMGILRRVAFFYIAIPCLMKLNTLLCHLIFIFIFYIVILWEFLSSSLSSLILLAVCGGKINMGPLPGKFHFQLL